MPGKLTILFISLFIVAGTVQPIHQSLKGGALPLLLPVRDFVANRA